MKIGIFGAQGKFGSELHIRLKALAPDGVELLPTVDKEHNKEIASECDLVIVSVRVNDVEDLLKEIAPFLKEDTQVLSFVAPYALQEINGYSNRPSGRMISDPWWGIAAYCLEPTFDTSGLDFLFSNLSKTIPKRLDSDVEIDKFTILIAYLFAVLLLYRNGEIENINIHLAYLSEELGPTQTELFSLMPIGDAVELLATASTKGGITEKIVSLIRSNREIAPDEIIKSIS